jgi:hypothetical protein
LAAALLERPHWEAIDHIKSPDGKSNVYSVRLNQQIRALAFRDGISCGSSPCVPTTTRRMNETARREGGRTSVNLQTQTTNCLRASDPLNGEVMATPSIASQKIAVILAAYA